MIDAGLTHCRRMRSVFAAAILFVTVTACGSSPRPSSPATARQPIVDATAQTAQNVARVAAKPVFVEFYTTWCAPCKQMEPALYRLQDEYGARVDFKILDAAGAAPEKQKYRYVSQPQVVIVDARGEIVNTLYGYQSYESLKAQLDTVLAMR